MDGQHAAATTGQRLASQDAIAHVNAQLALSANMLLKRNDKARRQWNLSQRRTV